MNIFFHECENCTQAVVFSNCVIRSKFNYENVTINITAEDNVTLECLRVSDRSNFFMSRIKRGRLVHNY